MNKNIITKFLSLAAVALIGWGCETNYFNEQYLDGYEQDNTITDVQTINYTLSEDDYSAIANNKTNKDIAAAQGEDAVAALSAIGKNKYFGSADEAAAYIPAFVASAYPTVDDGSVVMVTYTTATEVPAELQKMNAATEYTLKDADYQTIWGSEEEFVKAITPATESKLLTVVPSEGLEAGDYVAVTYNYSAEEPYNPDEQPEEPGDEPGDEPETPVVPEVTFPGDGKYLIVAMTDDASYAATALVADKTYGYPTPTAVTVENGQIVADDTTNALAWTVAAAANDGEYTLLGADNRYYYMKGTYNSFNVADEVGEEGFTYTFAANDDGTFTITNVAMSKTMQYDSSYSSFGIYPDVRGVVPHLFVLNEAGTAYVDVTTLASAPSTPAGPVYKQVSSFDGEGQYLIVAMTDDASYAATALVADKTYGYPTPTAVTVENGQIVADDTTNALAWTVAAAANDGEYTLLGADNRYYYMKGTYNSFNVADEVGEEGFTYTFAANDDGTFTITNVAMSKTLQYDPNYSSFGIYPDVRGVVPHLFKLVGNTSSASATRASIKIDASEKLYAYLKWNGSAFEKSDVLAVQPADYTAMGQKYGNFTNPDQDTYLPQFLAQAFPYAQEGDVKNVAFRCYAGGATSWKVDEYVSNGQAWVKTIYFEDKTDQFRKAEGVWNIDRTLELDFTNTSSADTKAFYQYCVNWVYDNKDVPMGAPARDNAGVIVSTDIVTIDGAKPAGNYWVSNYGNNEFYTGASAYYGNMDWRPSAVKGGFAAAGLGDLSDDEILAALKQNTTEVFAEVLHYVYPTMTPEEYKKVVIKVYAYGPNKNYSFDFAVVGEGQFEYVADSITEL